NTAAGNYTITIQATSGTVSHALVISVRVTTSGLLSILTGILNPSNSMSIGAWLYSPYSLFSRPQGSERFTTRSRALLEEVRSRIASLRELQLPNLFYTHPAFRCCGGQRRGTRSKIRDSRRLPTLVCC